ncbi:sterol desaturase family protein [Thalassotalea euphylliae]|uniref:Sterol desaturase family protein n=1 Tax=Thalassotalea euphylliae TaxID=1655234 RepID=A0A3E0TVI2_9GAMM|nr:sterol desaturase family protein [Thalassotalea euphylliae]REL28479.1 sterol desaturase family protein [Thalassotalea euphylliae]
MLDFFLSNFKELSLYVLDANKRIYWGYIASSIALATLVFWRVSKQRQTSPLAETHYNAEHLAGKSAIRRFWHFLFPASIYLSQSAKNDYALFVLNKLLKAALFPLVVITMVPIALGISSALESVFGVIEHIQLSAATTMLVFTVLLFIVDDFTRFLLHYMLHKIPFMWEFHKVHHSAKVLTPFTIYRSHPVESYLYACRMALTQGTVVGLCYFLFGPTLKMIDIVGANLFVFAFNIMGSNLRHSHIWLSWGDKVENWFISPAQHQIHHSDSPKLFDVNLGSALAIWDRLFGTLVRASNVKKLSIGIGDEYAEHQTLRGIYLQPFAKSWQVLTRSFRANKTAKSKASKKATS